MNINVKKAVWRGWALGSLATFAAIETVAITNKHPNDTLSAVWWSMRTKLPVRLLIFPPAFWLIHHFFNPWDERTGGKDDAAVVALGVAVACVARYKDRNGF